MDDIFCIFNNEHEADHFLQEINTLSPTLKFTIEKERQSRLVFLDTEVIKEDGSLHFKWHKKPTNTGRYIPSNSYSPNQYKQSAIRSLIFRAHKICSKDEYFDECYNEIKSIFVANGYHPNLVDKIKGRVLNQHNRTKVNKQKVFWQLPYKEISVREGDKAVKTINSMLYVTSVQIAYRTNKTSGFFKNKDPVQKCQKSHLVYKYSCGLCPKRYIGETTRHLATRINEHQTGNPNRTEIIKHNHPIDTDNFTILLRTNYTKIAEAIFFKKQAQHHLLNENQLQTPIFLF